MDKRRQGQDPRRSRAQSDANSHQKQQRFWSISFSVLFYSKKGIKIANQLHLQWI